jgi:hypothetical protein
MIAMPANEARRRPSHHPTLINPTAARPAAISTTNRIACPPVQTSKDDNATGHPNAKATPRVSRFQSGRRSGARIHGHACANPQSCAIVYDHNKFSIDGGHEDNAPNPKIRPPRALMIVFMEYASGSFWARARNAIWAPAFLATINAAMAENIESDAWLGNSKTIAIAANKI